MRHMAYAWVRGTGDEATNWRLAADRIGAAAPDKTLCKPLCATGTTATRIWTGAWRRSASARRSGAAAAIEEGKILQKPGHTTGATATRTSIGAWPPSASARQFWRWSRACWFLWRAWMATAAPWPRGSRRSGAARSTRPRPRRCGCRYPRSWSTARTCMGRVRHKTNHHLLLNACHCADEATAKYVY